MMLTSTGHSYPQRRIARQQQIDTKGLSRRIAFWRDLRNRGPQSLRGEGLVPQKCLLTHGDPGDFLSFISATTCIGAGGPYPKQHIGRSNNFSDLAVATQHHSIQRRAKHECIEAYLLGVNSRFGFLELSRALLVFGLRRFAFVAIAERAIEVALELIVVDFELVQSVALFRVVLAAKNLAQL
jgi:hypothetical protein